MSSQQGQVDTYGRAVAQAILRGGQTATTAYASAFAKAIAGVCCSWDGWWRSVHRMRDAAATVVATCGPQPTKILAPLLLLVVQLFSIICCLLLLKLLLANLASALQPVATRQPALPRPLLL